MKRQVLALLFLAAIVAGCSAKKTDLVNRVQSDARDLIKQGNNSFRQGRYKEAAKYFDRARIKAISIDDLIARADADNNLGHLYLMAGNYDDADRKFSESLKWSESAHYDLGKASAMNSFGMLRLMQDDLDGANEYFEKARTLSDDDAFQVAVKSNLGELERKRGDLVAARSYLNDAFESALKLKKHKLAATAGYRMAQVESVGSAPNIDLAIMWGEKALDEDKKVEHMPGIVKDLELLSNLYSQKGDYQKQALYNERALDLKAAMFRAE